MKSKIDFLSRAGFSLVELLVVIAVIGILMGALVGAFGGASDSAKAAKCMTNLRNLAVAVQTCAMADSDGTYPTAAPYEYTTTTGKYYHRAPGWIGWLDPNPSGYDKCKSSRVSSSWTPHLGYRPENKTEADQAHHVLTNGILWQYCGRTAETYVCPAHVDALRKEGLAPAWSYVMNSLFGYDEKEGETTVWNGQSISGIYSTAGGSVKLSPERVLLFAEVPFATIDPLYGAVQNATKAVDTVTLDSVLQYDDGLWSKGTEPIGFNHKNGKTYQAHVAYADGHVAKLVLGKTMNESLVKNLTMWLCRGDDVVYNAGTYEIVSKADKNEK